VGAREHEFSTGTRERGTRKFRNANFRVPGAGARATVGAGAEAGYELELRTEAKAGATN